MRSKWTFYGAPVTYSVALKRADSRPPDGYKPALYVPLRSWAQDASQRAQLFELYEALFHTGVPRPPSNEDVRLVCERLEQAFRSGGLVAHQALPSPTTTLANQTAPAPAPKPPPPPVPTLDERTWFQISFVDELGQGIAGQDVAFSCSGTQQKKPTDGNGMAKLDNVEAASSFGNASIQIDPVRKALKPRWNQVRQGKVLTEDDGVKVVFLRGDRLEPVSIEAETPRTVSIQPYVMQARLLGMFFDTNKNFLLPKAIPSIRSVKRLYDENPDSTLLVVGHTDKSGEPSYNDPLSLERAKSVAEYLTDDVDSWLKRYDQSVYYKKRWGNEEDGLMVQALAEYGPKTPDQTDLGHQPPIAWYQKWHNNLPAAKRADNFAKLDEDGFTGTNTRTQLIGDYMNLDDTSLPKGTNVVCHGCGENFPLDKTGQEVAPDAQGGHDQLDRRVELFFFDGKLGVQPPPPGTNSKPGSQQYPEWCKRSKAVYDFSLDAKPLRVRALDPDGHLYTGIRYSAHAGSTLLAPGGMIPDDGVIEMLVPASIDSCTLCIYPYKDKPDESLEWELHVQHKPLTDSTRDKAQRLVNLGYLSEIPPSDKMAYEMRFALDEYRATMGDVHDDDDATLNQMIAMHDGGGAKPSEPGDPAGPDAPPPNVVV